MTEILQSPMPYRPDRQPSRVYQQFRFDVADTPVGLSLLPSGTEQIVVREPDPDWLTLSATRFRTLAAQEDQEDANTPTHVTLDDASRRIQQQLAGTALHAIEEHLTLWDSLQPEASTAQEARRAYRHYLDDRLPRLLPTTPPVEVRSIRKRLEDPKLALANAEQTPAAIRTCHDLIAQRVLADLSDEPPLVGTEPIPFETDMPDLPPLPKPSEVRDRWNRRTMPWLRANIGLMLAWHERQTPVLGRELSDPDRGFLYDIPEARVVIVASALGFTLVERADRMTRMPNGPGTTVRVTDLKAGRHVHTPPPESLEETAEQAIVYLTAIALIESRGSNKKVGYAIEFHTDSGVDYPRTVGPYDTVELPIVALGQHPPEVVDNAQRYEPILTDPIAAQAMLGKTEDLLDRIRERRRTLKGQTFFA